MYGEWLALHQVLAGKLCYTFIYMLGTLLNCQCCSSSGVTAAYTLERILFLDIGLAVTEINSKKQPLKCRDGMPRSMQTR